MTGTLYLVPTPIGNLGDISERCREILTTVDFIAAEDTRVSVKLLNHLNIKKELVSYHEHNKTKSGPRILERLQNGESCALVTDAGSPAISDPGEDLVCICAAHSVPICAIPGPCALITALSASALPTGRFCFEGFLSTVKKERTHHLESLKHEQRTMIFYEAPHRLISTLEALEASFGPDRRISLCRELTKLHEEFYRTTLHEAIAHYQESEPRGEFVLVVEGMQACPEESISIDDALALVNAQMSQGLSRKDAVKLVAAQTGLKKNTLYDASLNSLSPQ